MTLSEMLSKSSWDSLVLAEVGVSGAIRMVRDPTSRMVGFSVRRAGLSGPTGDFVEQFLSSSYIERVELFLMCEVLGGGPKVFRPTAIQLRALEEMEVNVPAEEFASPFPTIVIELPDDYSETKLVENPYAGEQFGRYVQGDRHRPSMSVLHWDRSNLQLIHSAIFEGTSVKSWCGLSEGEEVESWFGVKMPDRSTLAMTEDEDAVERALRRAALNYCLLLDEVGAKRVGAARPNEYAQLVKWCAKSNRHTARNRLQLATSPIVYAPHAEVALYRTVATHSELSAGHSGRTVGPHHRRGHYKMQPHGPRGSLRKRIRVPGTFVNSHLLVGGAPTVTYNT